MMILKVWFWFFSCALLATPSVFAGERDAPLEIKDRVRLGVTTQVLMPDNLPDFSIGVLAFGPTVIWPIGFGAIQLQGIYGTSEQVSLLLGEANFRLELENPHLKAFVASGVDIGTYFSSKANLNGVNLNYGFSFNIADGFTLDMAMKLYFFSRRVVALGGSLMLIL